MADHDLKKRAENPVNFALKFIALIYKIVIVYCQLISNVLKTPVKKSIRGQTILITGSGHGLGRELALKLAQQHEVSLILVDINEKNNRAVKEEISRISKQKVLSYSVDIRDEAEVGRLAEKVRHDLDGGQVDILINNAGIVQCLPFLELSPQLVERTFQVNTLAHIWTIKHFLPAMLSKKRGHIVAISSIAGIIGGRYLTDYW